LISIIFHITVQIITFPDRSAVVFGSGFRSKNTDSEEQANTTDTIHIDKRTTIANPIPELISYIKQESNVDVEKKINEYVSEITKKEEE
jgi:hypothetical protein